MTDQETYNGLKNEMDVIGKAAQCLYRGTFSGDMAQDVAISQMYLQGLYTRIKQEVDRLAPANAPLGKGDLEGKPVSAVNPVVVGAASTGQDS